MEQPVAYTTKQDVASQPSDTLTKLLHMAEHDLTPQEQDVLYQHLVTLRHKHKLQRKLSRKPVLPTQDSWDEIRSQTVKISQIAPRG